MMLWKSEAAFTGGSESSKFTTGQKYKSAQNSCTNDTPAVTSSMSASGRQTKATCDLTIANGVTLTTTSRATQTVRNLTLITLTVANATPDASLAGAQLSFTAFLVQMMERIPLITRGERFVQQNVGMGYCH